MIQGIHNLGVPADPKSVLQGEDPVEPVLDFLSKKIAELERAGIARSRIIVDPGIGFGKTASQSWRLLQNAESFMQLNTRILYGHSRKSFFKTITANEAKGRDIHSLVISNELAKQDVDIVRVHNLDMHLAAQETRWRFKQGF